MKRTTSRRFQRLMARSGFGGFRAGPRRRLASLYQPSWSRPSDALHIIRAVSLFTCRAPLALPPDSGSIARRDGNWVCLSSRDRARRTEVNSSPGLRLARWLCFARLQIHSQGSLQRTARCRSTNSSPAEIGFARRLGFQSIRRNSMFCKYLRWDDLASFDILPVAPIWLRGALSFVLYHLSAAIAGPCLQQSRPRF